MTPTLSPNSPSELEEIKNHGLPSMETFSQLVDVPVTLLKTLRESRRKTYDALLFSASIWYTH